MQAFIILFTFLLGVVLCGVAVISFFKKRPAGQKHEGELSIMGVTIRGTSGPVLFLFIGFVLVWAGFGWASTEKDKLQAKEDRSRAVAEAMDLDTEVVRLTAVNQRLTNELPREVFTRIQREQPELLEIAPRRLSPSVQAMPVKPSN